MVKDEINLRYDLHIHSKYSYDSFMNPIKITQIAKKKGLDGVAITDHNTIEGGLVAYKFNDDTFQVIIGSEIKTEYGDIIGLFLNEEIGTNVFGEVVDQIKAQDGIVILAHPYRQFKFPEKLAGKTELIEVFNARSKNRWNDESLKLAQKLNKVGTAGSDAHTYGEIGRGTIISSSKLSRNINSFNNLKIEGNESNYYFYHGISVTMEKIKKVIS